MFAGCSMVGHTQVARRGEAGGQRRSPRRARLPRGAAIFFASAVLSCWAGAPHRCLQTARSAFAGPLGHRGRASYVGLRGGGGFGAAPARAPVEVAEPKGGWPTVSVFLVSANSKVAALTSLQQLEGQDYPHELIKEIIIVGGQDTASDAPATLKGAVRDFASKDSDELDLRKELAGCGGDVVVFWGDDHVSPAHRLKAQVASALEGERTASVLQPTWFFDPVARDFLRVKEWPSAQYREFLETTGQTPVEGLAELMVSADPITLCARRSALEEASAQMASTGTPTEELKEMLTHIAEQRPQIMTDLLWAAVRTPPEATQFEPGRPDSALEAWTQEAWPKGTDKNALDAVVKEIKGMKPALAIERLLAENVRKSLSGFDSKRLRQTMEQLFSSASSPEVTSAIAELSSWDGLAPGRGDVQMAKNFPIFFACFAALRKHTTENADFWNMQGLGENAEGLVKLASRIWGADQKVTEVLTKTLAQELYKNQANALPAGNLNNAEFVGTLGLRKPLEEITYAAMEIPGKNFPVAALCSLAWALGEAGIENSGLQLKVARGVIAEVNKLTPADVGKLFVAMEEKRWFKDATTIGYLTEALIMQVKELKKNDPGLSKILAESQEQSQAQPAA